MTSTTSTTRTPTPLSRRSLLQALGLGIGGAALAACAPSAPAPTASSGASGGAAANFRLASWTLADSVSKAGVQHLMQTYQAAKHVTITGVPIDYNNYLSQLLLQIRGGQFTGAVQLDIAWLSQIASLGKLRDLGSQAKGVDYTATALKTGQLNGKQYGLPWTTGGIGLLANKTLLTKVGASAMPSTLDDFVALLKELKTAGTIPYAASTKVAQLKDIVQWMQTFGSPIVADGKVTIGDDASIDAVTWYKGLYDSKLIAPGIERNDARALFAQGKAAMYDDAIVGKDVVVKQASDPTLKTSILPAKRPVRSAGQKSQVVAWGHVACVVEGAGADSAADFAKWATSDKAAVLAYFKDVSLPPTTSSALADTAVTSDTFTTDFTKQITANAAPSPLWVFPQYEQMEKTISTAVEGVLTGQANAKDAMVKAGKDLQALV